MPTRPLSGLARAAKKIRLRTTDDVKPLPTEQRFAVQPTDTATSDERFTKADYYLRRELIAGWLLCSVALSVFLVINGTILSNAILGGCAIAVLYACILPGIAVLIRISANLSALRQHGDADLVVPSLSVLMNSVHKCKVTLDMTAADAYEHSLKALHSLKTARVEKVNILQGSITAISKSSVRLIIDIQPDSENKSTLKLVAAQAHFSLREDEVLATLLQLRRALVQEHPEWCDLSHLFRGYRWLRLRNIGSNVIVYAALMSFVVMLVPDMWRGQEEAYARAYLTLGDYAAAYDHAKNCSSETGSTITMISAALSGNISEARKVLASDLSLKDNPANVALLSVLEGNYDKAQIELDQESDATFLYETGAKHLVRGLIAEHNGELKKAVEEFDLALQLYADSTFVKAEMIRVLSKHGKQARISTHIESLDIARAETLNSIQWGPATLLGFALLWLAIFFNYVRTEKLRSAHDYFIFQRESTSPCS